ncbi:MAG: hypothetical protein K2H48_01890 [Duncaniella sp.]|nr:hypothetical protein [Duncaniella sp.]
MKKILLLFFITFWLVPVSVDAGISSTFYSPVASGAKILLKSLLDGACVAVDNIEEGSISASIDIHGVPSGLYAVIYTVDGILMDQSKIKVD